MSRICSLARLALPGLLALSAIALPQAASASASVSYRCNYPLHNTGDATIDLDVYTPEVVFPGEPLDGDVTVVAKVTPLKASGFSHYPGAVSLAGTGKATFSVEEGDGWTHDVAVPLAVETSPLGTDSTPLYGEGVLPTSNPEAQGVTEISAGPVAFNLSALDASGNPIAFSGPDFDAETWPDSDGDKKTFDVTCWVSAPGPTVSRVIVDNLIIEACDFGGDFCPAPSAPRHVRVGGISTAAAELRWTRNSLEGYGDYGRFAYDVEIGGKTQRVSGKTAPLTGLKPGTTYSGTIRAVYLGVIDRTPKISEPTPFTFTTAGDKPDTTAPSAPVVTAGASTVTSASITWLPSTDDVGVVGYDLFLDQVKVGTVGPASLSYTFTGLIPGTRYDARVVARDAAGNASAAGTVTLHGVVCAPGSVGPPIAVPPMPTVGFSTTEVEYFWLPPADGGPCAPAALAGYRVRVDGRTFDVPAGTTKLRVSGLQPDRSYTALVSSVDTNGNESTAIEIERRTLPEVDPGPAQRSYDVTGSATISTLLRGVVPQKGGSGLLFTGPKGKRTANGNVTLTPTQGRLVGLGFLPITVKIAFVSSGEARGVLTGSELTLSQAVRLKVQEAKLFGAIPLASGNSCQTKQLTDLSLSSNGSPFDEVNGGSLTGKFKISDLNGCGPFNGLVSPLVAGGGNTIALKFAPKPAG